MPNWRGPGSPETCEVCRGTGWVILEDDTPNAPAHIKCEYCHGTGTNAWVKDARKAHVYNYDLNRSIVRSAMGLYTGFLLYSAHWPYWSETNATGNSPHVLFLMGLWVLGILGWLFVLAWFPKVRTRQRHAPGFTTTREKASVGALAAGIGLKNAWEQHERRIDAAGKQADKNG